MYICLNGPTSHTLAFNLCCLSFERFLFITNHKITSIEIIQFNQVSVCIKLLLLLRKAFKKIIINDIKRKAVIDNGKACSVVLAP